MPHDAQQPAWWAPYADEFPDWQAWEGVSGLLYARRPRSSPPLVMRDTNPVLLAAQIRAWYRENPR